MSIENLGGIESFSKVAEELQSPGLKMNQLIQYAQGTNPLVPSFLALAEIQRRQALTKVTPGQPVASTVAQDLVSKAEAPLMAQGMAAQMPQQAQGLPAMQRPQGVAALPSNMGERSFAGGGIVAFAGDEGSEVEDPYEGLSFTEKLKRLRAAEDEDTAPKSSLFKRGMPSISNFEKNLSTYAPSKSADADAQPGGYYGGGKAPTLTPDSLGRFVANSDSTSSRTSAPTPRVTSTQAAKELSIPQAPEKADIYGKYEKMFNEQAAQASSQREKDKWMRVVEAGLGILGGTSQHGLVNIGQGAMGAVKGYAQDLAAQRKEDRQNVMDLMALGMKKEEAEREVKKLNMTEKLYGAHGRYYDAAAAAAGQKVAGAGNAANTRLTIAQQNLVHKYFQDLKKDMNNMGVSDEVLMQKAMTMAGVQGGPSASAAPTISYGDFASSLKNPQK